MDYEQALKFAPYLAPGETVRWVGKPFAGIALGARDVFLIPFSLLWCAFAIFWETLAIQSGQWFMIAWGVPFVLVGLFIVFGRFLLDAFWRRRTLYALTDTNALILRGSSLTAIDLRTISAVDLKIHNAGSGTISFGAQLPMTLQADPWNFKGNTSEFVRIDGAEDVYRMIQKSKAQPR